MCLSKAAIDFLQSTFPVFHCRFVLRLFPIERQSLSSDELITNLGAIYWKFIHAIARSIFQSVNDKAKFLKGRQSLAVRHRTLPMPEVDW